MLRPAPSSWRNGLIQDVASTDAGIAALTSWATMWRRGRVLDATVALWTAATVSPVDSGWLANESDTAGHPLRKLRPIACAEVLIKLVETLFHRRTGG